MLIPVDASSRSSFQISTCAPIAALLYLSFLEVQILGPFRGLSLAARLDLTPPFSFFTPQRTVDRLYVDRTFGGQDWFGLRQQAIKVGIGFSCSTDPATGLREHFIPLCRTWFCRTWNNACSRSPRRCLCQNANYSQQAGRENCISFKQSCDQDAAKGMTEAELNSALAKLLSSLGDRYTRYLPPAKYATIVQVCLIKCHPDTGTTRLFLRDFRLQNYTSEAKCCWVRAIGLANEDTCWARYYSSTPQHKDGWLIQLGVHNKWLLLVRGNLRVRPNSRLFLLYGRLWWLQTNVLTVCLARILATDRCCTVYWCFKLV